MGALCTLRFQPSTQAQDLPEGEPSITGTITEASPVRGGGPGNTGIIFVEEKSGRQGDYGHVIVGEDTRVLRSRGETLVEATTDELAVGQQVQVWVHGWRLSDPPRGGGRAIVIIDQAGGGTLALGSLIVSAIVLAALGVRGYVLWRQQRKTSTGGGPVSARW